MPTAELPKCMRTMERDRRGYPIPAIVQRDASGCPHFAINDQAKVQELARKKLCAITGRRMTDGFWFIGGPKSLLHEHGAFMDGPMLYEPALYSLQVCPYLSGPHYGKSVGMAKAMRAEFPATPHGYVRITEDLTMDPNRPTLFGLARCESFTTRALYFIPGPWTKIEWYRRGERTEITDEERHKAVNDL